MDTYIYECTHIYTRTRTQAHRSVYTARVYGGSQHSIQLGSHGEKLQWLLILVQK